MKKLLVTAALPYANGPIHIGHLVEYVQADIWVRYWKLRGRDALYLCADDTHGTPIMLRARAEDITPEELIERVHGEHHRDFTGFQIEFDEYHSTNSEENRGLVERLYRILSDEGHFVEKTIEQAFCPREQHFLPDRYIKGTCPQCRAEDQYGDSCEVCSSTYTPRDLLEPRCAHCGATPEWRSSQHLFFRLGQFDADLRRWVDVKRLHQSMVNKLREWLEEGLRDWDVSRDAPYFGFEIPDRPGQYFYVWLDAPIGYMASTLAWCNAHGASFDAYWKSEDAEVVHFIGKDIVYFHALFWPALLRGAGFRMPSRLQVHGFLTVDGVKMSKTRGTFLTAETYLRHLDPQYLRYYYATRLTSRVEDLDLRFDDFVKRVNSELLNKIVNIPSRVLSLLHNKLGGRLGRLDDAGRALVGNVLARREAVAEAYETCEFARGMRLVLEAADEVNAYLQDHAPWKQVDEAALATCTAALNGYRVLVTYLAPVLPTFGASLAKLGGLEEITWDALDASWEDRPVGPHERLIERLDRESIDRMVSEQKAAGTGRG